jgi:hypothetical protein
MLCLPRHKSGIQFIYISIIRKRIHVHSCKLSKAQCNVTNRNSPYLTLPLPPPPLPAAVADRTQGQSMMVMPVRPIRQTSQSHGCAIIEPIKFRQVLTFDAPCRFSNTEQRLIQLIERVEIQPIRGCMPMETEVSIFKYTRIGSQSELLQLEAATLTTRAYF